MQKATPALVILLLIGGLPALAQECGTPHCGPYYEDTGEDCYGPDDPFCRDDGGGSMGCWECIWIAGSPDGQTGAAWVCIQATDPAVVNGAPSRCTDGDTNGGYCEMSGMCQLA